MTSQVTIYHIPSTDVVNGLSHDPCCINLIDTPGFGDTRGPEWDKKISQMITELLSTIPTLDYILMVVKATDNRLGEASKFVYNQIQNLYAQDISERVLGMFTHTDGNEPLAIYAVEEAKIKIATHFRFNNSAMWAKADGLVNCVGFFALGMENYEKFTSYIRDKD